MTASCDRYPGLVTVLMFAVMTVGATIFGFSALLPDIAGAFGVSVARAGVLPGVFGLALAGVAPAVGLLAQAVPRDRVITAGLLVYAAAWGGAVTVSSFESLLVLAALAGGATGAVLPAAYAYAADASGFADRARVMGRVVLGWSLAILVMVPLMSVIAQFGDWRWAFGVLAASAAVVAVAVHRVRRPPPPQAALGPRAAALGRSLWRVLSDAPTMIVIAANMIDMGAYYAVYTFIASELRRLNGIAASAAGMVIAAYGLGLAIASANGRLFDRWGKKRSGVVALTVLSAWLVLLPWLAVSPWAMAAGVLVWGCVQGAFFTSITTLATEQVPQHRGVVTALLGGSTYLGVSLYTPVSTYLFENVGYWAVGLAAGLGTLGAAWLLSRLQVAAR